MKKTDDKDKHIVDSSLGTHTDESVSSCSNNGTEGIIIPMCDLMKDALEVIEKDDEIRQEKLNRTYGYYDGYDDDDYDFEEEMAMQRDYFSMFCGGISDEEWNDYVESQRLYYDAVNGNNDYSSSSKKGKGENSKKPYSSQKFINGREVDDEEFEEYNRRASSKTTRRGGKKHSKHTKTSGVSKRTTRYNDDDWWDSHTRDDAYPTDEDDYYTTDRDTWSDFANEKKRIVFYRNLPDKEDILEWDSLFEFNEWLQENGITVEDSDISSMVYSQEIHCCLSVETTDKILVVDRDYGGLAWEVTGGDLDMLKDKTNHWNFHGI